MTSRRRVVIAALTVTALGTALLAPLASGTASAGAVTIDGARSLSDKVEVSFKKPSGATTDVHLLAWNDFHGNLEAGTLNIYGRYAGGAAWLAKAVKDKQQLYGSREATVFAGDNIGASPLADALFYGEPSTIVANLMHTDVASVGNHEFDKGFVELKRIQKGGCRQDVGCTGAPYATAKGGSKQTYPGADFQYLAANVIRNDTGKPLFPATATKTFKTDAGGKITVGFIGEVLQSTPTIVTPTGVAGLTFIDEADAANAAAAKLKKRGVNTIVLVIHQGGFQSGTPSLNGCAGNLAGSDIEPIVKRLDPSIRVIVSGHTHAEYRCTIEYNGATRLITSAASFGRILSDITLRVENRSGLLTDALATNSIVANTTAGVVPSGQPRPAPDLPFDQQVASVVGQYVTNSAPLANKVVAKVTADITNSPNALGEIPSGDVIADAQLAATAPANLGAAVVAFMNPGGIRGGATGGFLFNQISGGEAPGDITYGEAFTVQPFGNSLVTKTMTGAQIRSLLEQQFVGCGGQTGTKILQISAGFSYDQVPDGATCAAKIGAITLNGQPIGVSTAYRVTMNNFLATGGDGFTVFASGTEVLGGAQDIDALVQYFVPSLTTPLAPPAGGRIT
jgi:5'-nucleotidase